MKTHTSIIIIFLSLFATVANTQTRWRVNNTPGVNADFTSVQAAIDSANAGDIIYIENSGIPYDNNIEISKQLTLLGPGYFLASNDSTQANKSNTMLPNVAFNSESSGSVMMGVWVTNHLTVSASNIVIARNRVNNLNLARGNEAGNIVVSQNYLTSIENGYSSYNYYFTAVIMNNIIIGRVVLNEYGAIEFRNNSVYHYYYNSGYPTVSIYNSTIKNNVIFRYPENTSNYAISCDESHNNTIEYNLCNQDSVAIYPNNLWEINVEDVIVNVGGPETKYYLKEGSPAIGYGEFGVDCGAFGGDSPYILSGLPPLPHIFKTSIPISGTSNNGLPVNVKIKSQN